MAKVIVENVKSWVLPKGETIWVQSNEAAVDDDVSFTYLIRNTEDFCWLTTEAGRSFHWWIKDINTKAQYFDGGSVPTTHCGTDQKLESNNPEFASFKMPNHDAVAYFKFNGPGKHYNPYTGRYEYPEIPWYNSAQCTIKKVEPPSPLWAGLLTIVSSLVSRLMTAVGSTFGSLASAASSAIAGLAAGIQSTIATPFQAIVDGITDSIQDALAAKTLPEETEESVSRLVKGIQDRIKDEIEAAATSPLTADEAVGVASKIAVGGLGAASVGLTLAAAADQAHPLKNIGFRNIVSTAVGLMGVDSLIKPIVTVPYDIGILTPLRQYYQKVYTPFIPGMADAVRFAVREAHRAELQEGTAETFIQHAKLLGFSEKWAKYYWAAHWIIPNYAQAREAFWRGVLTEEEFVKLRAYADLAPAYSDVWEGLQYNLPGRIDARWMYEWGSIDKAKLKELLGKGGLDPAWLDAVTDAYVANQLRDEKGRVRTQFVSLYVDGLRTADKLKEELATLGYRSEAIEWIIQEADLRRERELKGDQIKSWIKFLKSELKLAKSALKAEEITEDEFKTKLKAAADTFAEEMRAIGVVEDAIVLYINSVLPPLE